MTDRPVLQENVLFKPMQAIYDILNNNILDVNQDRRTQTDVRNRQWIFPDTPESNDENYPRLAIIPGNMQTSEYGAGRYIQTIRAQNGDAQSETRGVIVTLPITVGAFTKKLQTHNVQLEDESYVAMKNKKLADYMAYQINQVLIRQRNNLIAQQIDIEETATNTAYVDNEFLYASDVTFNLIMFLAVREDFDINALIRQIDLTINVTT